MTLLFHENRLLLLNRSKSLYCDMMEEPDPEEEQAMIYDLMNPDMKSSSIEFVDIALRRESKARRKTRVNGFLAEEIDVSAAYRRVKTKRKHVYLRNSLDDYWDKPSAEEEAGRKRVKLFRQELKVWVSEDFPIKLRELEPLMSILARGNKLMRELKGFLGKSQSLSEGLGFPIKAQIPLNFAIKAVIKFVNFRELEAGTRETEELKDAFRIPE